MEQMTLKIVGTHPLMMHADTLANPLHAATKAHKELTGQRKKSDDIHEAIARSEFIASCYFDQREGFYIPGTNLDASFVAGAKLSKLGTHWKRGVLVFENRVKLLHDGPATPDALWADARYRDCRAVKVGAARLMRYRPVFQTWAAKLTVHVNTDVLSVSEVRKAIDDAGALIGVCEYRPRFGRFEVSYE